MAKLSQSMKKINQSQDKKSKIASDNFFDNYFGWKVTMEANSNKFEEEKCFKSEKFSQKCHKMQSR